MWDGGSPEGSAEVRGGIGKEYKDQHVGKVWRFEEEVGNGGTGVDSSEASVGSDGVEMGRIGNEVRVFVSADCRIQGSEDCMIEEEVDVVGLEGKQGLATLRHTRA